ncbi:MAG: hydrogenase expression protein HupH [Alphaproteobacteria bacterium]|nr:hydrogenase expression protein HupH [Alphaproteobacteria bacterium]
MFVHVRVITPITTRGFRKASDFAPLCSPDLTVSMTEIDTGPASIECDYDEMLAVPGTVAKMIEAEREGVDALIIDCMGDPGLRPGREVVSIPVIGPMQAGMHLAAMLGHSFSVVTVLKRLRPFIEDQASLYGLPGKLASVRAVDIPVLELEDDRDGVKRKLTEQALLAVEEDGADAIIFGCTGMLGCADAVREGLLARGYDAPVIDPVPTAVRLAHALVRSGLSHSKVAFPVPPAKPVVGYAMPARVVARRAAE